MASVLDYLEKTAGSRFGKNRVDDMAETVSYEELLNLSQNVGAVLLGCLEPVSDEPARKPVPIIMDKGINALIAFFGVVYSGHFYCLINPDLPNERIENILAVTKPEMIITDRKNFEKTVLIAGKQKIFCIEDLRMHEISDTEKERLKSVRSKMIDTDPLYANFTSGSTGIPKGVLVSHRSVIDFIDIYTELFDITGRDIIGNQAPFDFDVSVKDIYSALKTGANLVIIKKELFSKPAELLDCLCDKKITVMTWAVSALCLITTFHALDYKVPRTVKKVLFSGEVMPIKHLREWMEHLPEAVFVNLYGPTEITCNCTYHVIDRDRAYEEAIPIGTAFPNERVFLLDGEDRLISPKEAKKTGELCVAGTALALGYYNSPAETAKAFVVNPVNSLFPETVYRTGDLAFYNEAGELIFAGRKDFQIKHMGHRIELEEVERSMMSVEGVERSCCVFDEKRSRLTGFYVGGCDSKELHRLMSEKLPAFMVPGALKPLVTMPMTKNGKIDRKLLANLAADRRAYKEYVEETVKIGECNQNS